MKSDVFSQDNQSVGNNMPTDNLNTGGVNTPKELNDNNDGSVPAVENAASSDLNSANEALNSESVINSEVIGVTNNENENLNNLSGEESLPPENNLNNTKNRKKIFIIIGIVVGVIILAIIAFFVYIKIGFTAEKYIDDKVEEISTFIDDMFMTNNYNADADTIMNGELSINSSIAELAALNNLNLNFEVGTSLAKEIVDINFGLANNESNYNANLYINNNRMYLDSDDLYSTPLYMDLEESPFANINVEKMNLENYKNSIVNFVKYLGLALKESDMSSSISGLSAIYRYEINDINKKAFAQKMNDLIEQDENMLDFLEMLGVTDATVSADSLSDMVFEVTVSIPSGDLKGFTLTIDDSVMNLVETAKDKYDFKIDDEVVLKVTVDGDNVNLVNADTNSGTFDITFNTKDYTMKTNFESEGNVISLEITNESDKVKNVVIELTSNNETSVVNMKVDLTVETVSNNEIRTSGSFVVSSNGEDINLDFTLNSQNGTDLVTEKTFTNAKDMNTLTPAEENEISNNLMTVLENIAPEVTETMGAQQFLISAQVYADTVSLSVTPGGCMTFEQLGYNTGMLGKVEPDSLGGYRLSITDGEYMVLDKYIFDGNLSAEDVERYDSFRFTEEYYTCLAS